MRRLIYFAPPDGGTSGAAGAGAGAGEGAAGAGAGGAGAWTPPEGLDAQFVGKDANETLGKLMPAYTNARATIAKMPAIGKSADDYMFDTTDATKAYFPKGRDEPMFGVIREVAHKLGLPKDSVGAFVNGVYEEAGKKGLLPSPLDAKQELATFKTAAGLTDQSADQKWRENTAFAEGLGKQLAGSIPEAQREGAQAAFMQLTDNADGQLALSALMKRLNDSGIRVAGDGTTQGALTKEDLDAMAKDPRIDPANKNHKDESKRYDPAFRQRYEDGMKALYPKQ